MANANRSNFESLLDDMENVVEEYTGMENDFDDDWNVQEDMSSWNNQDDTPAYDNDGWIEVTEHRPRYNREEQWDTVKNKAVRFILQCFLSCLMF